MERLRKSSRRLIWVNPLLRFDGFSAKAQGVRAMLPHVDEFGPIHNLASMADLCRDAVGRTPGQERPQGLVAGLGMTGPCASGSAAAIFAWG